MMMGKPIIASNISDIPIILDNGKCGLLVRPGSIDDLKEKIEYLLDNTKKGLKFGRNAKKRYKEKYSYMQKEKIINEVYSRLL